MSAGLAHEFKNAMAALHGYAQFLQTIDTDDQGKTATDALLQEVRNLSEMTTAFLNFARPQALQLEEISLNELIEGCARELLPMFADRRVEFIFSVGEPVTGKMNGKDAGDIRADARMLRQAFLNLIRNAVEAIPDASANRRVTISMNLEDEAKRRWAKISTHDTGSGIPDSDLQKIFIPFFTTKSQGHGVGLALAHRVITEHGGTLTVANAPEGGAVFTIRLPQYRN